MPSKSKNILHKENHKPNKLLGQNFLRDKKILNKIIAAANLTTKDNVLEIGPGLGVLTRELAKRSSRVIAVEKDKTLAEILTKQLTEEKIENVEVVADDILKINRQALFGRHPDPAVAGEGSPARLAEAIAKRANAGRTFVRDSSLRLRSAQNDNAVSYKVVANIPYYLTSHLIRLLLEGDNPPTDIILMIQKEVAKRICAKPPRMSLLSVSVQFYANAKIIASVSKNFFWPKPKVDSAIIRITPHNNFFPLYKRGIEGDLKSLPLRVLPLKKGGVENFFRVLHSGFSHPRKQLLNNLSAGLAIPRDKISAILQSADIKPQQRAETLSVEDWIKLTKLFFYPTKDLNY